MYSTVYASFFILLCFPVSQLQSLLTLLFLLFPQSYLHHLSRLCSSPFSFLLSCFKPAVKSFSNAGFPSLIFKPTLPSFFTFSPVVRSQPPSLPPTPQTLLMDPMSAEYQSKPHNCTVASCLYLPQCLSSLDEKNREE